MSSSLVLSPLAALAVMCALGSEEIDGNWFCQPVNAIQYSDVGSCGHYNRITAMNSDGTCHSIPQAFSGPISPLDGEVGPYDTMIETALEADRIAR